MATLNSWMSWLNCMAAPSVMLRRWIISHVIWPVISTLSCVSLMEWPSECVLSFVFASQHPLCNSPTSHKAYRHCPPTSYDLCTQDDHIWLGCPSQTRCPYIGPWRHCNKHSWQWERGAPPSILLAVLSLCAVGRPGNILMHRFIEELVMGRQHPLVKLRLSALATSFAVSLVCGVRRTYTASLGAASW